jgi:hypothetical protein
MARRFVRQSTVEEGTCGVMERLVTGAFVWFGKF